MSVCSNGLGPWWEWMLGCPRLESALAVVVSLATPSRGHQLGGGVKVSVHVSVILTNHSNARYGITEHIHVQRRSSLVFDVYRYTALRHTIHL